MELTLDEATAFLSLIFFGEHHIPYPIKKCGDGWSVNVSKALSTTDFNDLTRIVILAHDMCIRAELSNNGRWGMRLALHKRNREGLINTSHPTLESQISSSRDYFEKQRQQYSNKITKY